MSEHNIYLNSLDTAEEWARRLLAGMKDKGMHCTAESIAAHCLFALTERLRAVEAERDEAKRETEAHDSCNDMFMAQARAELSALRAELRRKDAALKEVLPWLERETPPQYVGVDREGLPVEYEPTAAEEACGMAAMVLRAALQPKEPPCKS